MMHEPPRPRERQVALTRGHLVALAGMAVALSAVTFFLGVQIGPQQAPPPEKSVEALLGPEAQTGELQALLTRVEQAQPGSQSLDFPRSLPLSNVPAGQGAMVPPTSGTASQSDEVPPGGWTLEVATYDQVAAAQAEILKLRSAGLPAWWTNTLVDGKSQVRVRIGSYSSAEAANLDLPRLAEAGVTTATAIKLH